MVVTAGWVVDSVEEETEVVDPGVVDWAEAEPVATAASEEAVRCTGRTTT